MFQKFVLTQGTGPCMLMLKQGRTLDSEKAELCYILHVMLSQDFDMTDNRMSEDNETSFIFAIRYQDYSNISTTWTTTCSHCRSAWLEAVFFRPRARFLRSYVVPCGHVMSNKSKHDTLEQYGAMTSGYSQRLKKY